MSTSEKVCHFHPDMDGEWNADWDGDRGEVGDWDGCKCSGIGATIRAPQEVKWSPICGIWKKQKTCLNVCTINILSSPPS